MKNINCNFCNSCNFCDSCINLKMTECNYFCYAEDVNKDGFQCPRYRVFNVEVGEEEYFKIEKLTPKLKFNPYEGYSTRYKTAWKNYWETLSEEEKQQYYNIPHFNRDIFTKITGIKQKELKEISEQ